MNFNSLIPEISVSDINKSRNFYLSLGFEIKYERPKLDKTENCDNKRNEKNYSLKPKPKSIRLYA